MKICCDSYWICSKNSKLQSMGIHATKRIFKYSKIFPGANEYSLSNSNQLLTRKNEGESKSASYHHLCHPPSPFTILRQTKTALSYFAFFLFHGRLKTTCWKLTHSQCTMYLTIHRSRRHFNLPKLKIYNFFSRINFYLAWEIVAVISFPCWIAECSYNLTYKSGEISDMWMENNNKCMQLLQIEKISFPPKDH